EELDGLTDGGALVGEEVHRALRDAVAHELPARVQHRPRDRLVRADHVGVDGRGRADLSLAERLEHPPEADAHAVVVPGPVGDVGHGRDPLRSGEVLAGGRRLDVPLLDVDDGPDGDARALGEPPGAPGGDGRIVEALVWQSHAGLLESVVAFGRVRLQYNHGPWRSPPRPTVTPTSSPRAFCPSPRS